MTLRPIRTKRGHQAALKELEALWEAPSGSPEADRLEVLTLLVEAYEREHYPIEAPDPIDFLQHVMQARGITRKDLEPYIGSRARVAEVLNRVRPLTLEMIRRLASGLKLPADVLIRGYELKRAASMHERSARPADTGQAMKERITKSSGNVFIDLGFSPQEAAVLAMRAELIAKLRTLIDERGWTQPEASKRLGIAQSRVSDLVRGKWDKFSLEMLVTLAAKAGQRPNIVLKAA